MRYKFGVGDLIITSEHHDYPGHRGILMERFKQHGTMVWHIHWLNGAPVLFEIPWIGDKDTEIETNLFNLRRRYHYYNKEGEYYESKD